MIVLTGQDQENNYSFIFLKTLFWPVFSPLRFSLLLSGCFVELMNPDIAFKYNAFSLHISRDDRLLMVLAMVLATCFSTRMGSIIVVWLKTVGCSVILGRFHSSGP